MKKKTALIAFALFVLPLVASAQDLGPLRNLIRSVNDIVAMLIPLAIAIALLVFFWGLIRYVWGKGGKIDQTYGKKVMIAGLVSLFVMVSVWGIIMLAQAALGIQNAPAQAPSVPGVGVRCPSGQAPGPGGTCVRN